MLANIILYVQHIYREKNIDCWVEAGGIGILHTKADDTIAKLNEIIES